MKRVPGPSVRTKLLIAFLLVAIVPLSAFAALVYTRTLTTLRQVEHDEITSLGTGFTSVLRSQLRDEKRFTDDYAAWSGLYYAVKDRRLAWLAGNCTDWVPSSSDTKLVVIFAPDGTVITRGGQRPPADLWDYPEVQASAHSAKEVTHADLASFNDRLYILATSPILHSSGSGPSAGVMVFGRPVTDRVLADINNFTGGKGNLAVFTGGQPSASTADTAGWSASASDVTGHGLGASYVEGGYTSQLVAIPDGTDTTVSLLKVSVPRATFVDALRKITTITVVAFVAAVILVFAIGLFMARTITRPLERLTRAAGAMSAGELRQRLDDSRGDEFGKLAKAFNGMSEQVAERVEQLSQKTQTLALEISVLSAFGTTLAQTPDADLELLRLAEMIRGMVEGNAVGIYIEDGDGLQLAAFNGDGAVHADAPALAELATRVASDGNAIAVGDLSAEKWLSERARQGDGLTRALAVPLTQRKAVAGALVVGYADRRELTAEELPMLVALAGQIAVALQNGQAYKKLDEMYLETVTALAAAMEAKDHYTAEHADSLATMAIEVGRSLGMHDADLRMLQYAAVLHDIGKIGVPGAILNKPDRLTEEEFKVMAEHTVIGERIIKHIDYLVPIAGMIRSAHERWDGRGYPDGIAGDDIPLASRILLVCDAFDAMTTDRPYRKALPDEVALEEIRGNAGTQFDPRVAEVFLAAYPFDEAAANGSRAMAGETV